VTLSLDDIIFRTRALAQTHPFSHKAQAFHNRTIAREKTNQPFEEMGNWASNAITVGYCLRRVEEDDSGVATWSLGPEAGQDAFVLDEKSSDLADAIRTGEGTKYLLYAEPLLIDALDRIIGGEIERRISDLADKVDTEAFEELESYIGWWTLKGYCLRVAEQLAASGDAMEPEGAAGSGETQSQ